MVMGVRQKPMQILFNKSTNEFKCVLEKSVLVCHQCEYIGMTMCILCIQNMS